MQTSNNQRQMPPSEEASGEETIRRLYTELALHPGSDFAWGKGIGNARALGYDPTWLDLLPAGVWESSRGSFMTTASARFSLMSPGGRVGQRPGPESNFGRSPLFGQKLNLINESSGIGRYNNLFVAQSYLSSVLASLWSAKCARVGLCIDWSLATPAYDSVPARCAVGLRGCGHRAPWLWPPRHWPRCSIRVGYRQVFPELQHALDRRTRSADICVFLECVAARPQTRLCRLRAGQSHENHLHQNLERV